MNNSTIYLPISKSASLRLAFEYPLQECSLYDRLILYLDHNEHTTLLSNRTADSLVDIVDFLNALLQKNRILHSSITGDIGRLMNIYNECNDGATPCGEFIMNTSGYWVGLEYCFLSTESYYTWLYQKNDTLYLEVTPTYPWHSRDPVKDEQVHSFATFMQTYQPLFITTVEQSAIQQWLEVINPILATLQHTTQEEVEAAQWNAALESTPVTNGPLALKNSIPYAQDKNFTARIGVSEGEIVLCVYDPYVNSYHGHVVDWHQLTPQYQYALTEAGLTTIHGTTLL